jgi:hypothetical protein
VGWGVQGEGNSEIMISYKGESEMVVYQIIQKVG